MLIVVFKCQQLQCSDFSDNAVPDGVMQFQGSVYKCDAVHISVMQLLLF